MDTLIKNTTLNPSGIANIYSLASNGMDSLLTSCTPTMWFMAVMFVFTWTMYYEQSTNTRIMMFEAVKESNSNFFILRDILEENNKEISHIREDTRSIRRMVTRNSKAKAEAEAASSLLEMNAD